MPTPEPATAAAAVEASDSVLKFGVANDGGDDIREAMALAIQRRENGRTLHFPAGTYRLGGTVDVTLTSPLGLILDPGARIIGDGTDAPMITLRGGPHRFAVSVSGGRFDNGDRAFDPAQQSGAALVLIDVDGYHVSGVVFGRRDRHWRDGFGDTGLTATRCQRGTVVGCTFYGQPDQGIYVTGGTGKGDDDDYGDLVVQGCHFVRCNGGVSAKRGSSRLVAAGNTFVDCRGGVTVFEAGGLPPGRLTVVQGNFFIRTGEFPIRIHGDGVATISGNVIEDFGGDLEAGRDGRGIWLNGAGRCVVSGNVIRFREWKGREGDCGIAIRKATIDGIDYAADGNLVCGNLVDGVHTGISTKGAGRTHCPDNAILGAVVPVERGAGLTGDVWDGAGVAPIG